MIFRKEEPDIASHEISYLEMLLERTAGDSLSDVLFFDIETTGLKAETSFLYMIGCMYFEGSRAILVQYLADDLSEEKELIESLRTLLDSRRTVLHFNGQTFDIPYIEKKCALLDLNPCFSDVRSIDLYKLLRPYKKLLGLTGLKQKDVERATGFPRNDRFSGNELIDVYKDFLVQKKMCREDKASEALELLFLHNHDDVRGMSAILPAFYALSLSRGSYSVHDISEHDKELVITLDTDLAAPFAISYMLTEQISFRAEKKTAVLRIAIYTGELRLFFENYKDYYYIPGENRVIHKSLGAFIDKSLRRPSTAAVCFEAHTGRYIPAVASSFPHIFRAEHKAKDMYIPISTLVTEAGDMDSAAKISPGSASKLAQYIHDIFNTFF